MFVFEFQGERRSKTGAKINDFSCETHRRCRKTFQNGKSNNRLIYLYVIKTLKLFDHVKFCLLSQQSFAHCIYGGNINSVFSRVRKNNSTSMDMTGVHSVMNG